MDEELKALLAEGTPDDELVALGFTAEQIEEHRGQETTTEGDDEGAQAGAAEVEPEQIEDEPQQPERGPEGKFVPRKALEAERGKRKGAQDRISRLEEMLERQAAIVEAALSVGKQARQQPETPRADPVAQKEADLQALDERYDAGEIDDSEHRRESRSLLVEITELKAEARMEAATRGTVEAEVQALASQNPWLDEISDEQFDDLETVATAKVDRSAGNLKGIARQAAIRREIIAAGNRLGFSGQPATRTGTSTSTDPRTAAARAKLAAAERHPPDLSRSGNARAAGLDDPEGTLSRMSDKDIMRGRVSKADVDKLTRAYRS